MYVYCIYIGNKRTLEWTNELFKLPRKTMIYWITNDHYMKFFIRRYCRLHEHSTYTRHTFTSHFKGELCIWLSHTSSLLWLAILQHYLLCNIEQELTISLMYIDCFNFGTLKPRDIKDVISHVYAIVITELKVKLFIAKMCWKICFMWKCGGLSINFLNSTVSEKLDALLL
jgi:hypothetical protein